MSPELAVLVLGFIGVLLNQYRNDVDSKKRYNGLKNDAVADKAAKIKRDDENDSKRDNLLTDFMVSFKSDADDLRRKLDEQTRDITNVKVENGELKGKLSILIQNQETDRTKITVLSRRITELENDGKFKDSLIETLTIERDGLLKKYEDGRNRIIGLTIELNQLKQDNNDLHNGVTPSQAALTVDKSAVVQTASNIDLTHVQTADNADNSIDDKEDNE